MKETYRPDLKAHVTVDASERVRAIRHTQEYWFSDQGSMMETAVSYLNAMADVYGVPAARLANLRQRVSYLNPREQGVEYRAAQEKSGFDSTTLGFYQTIMNTPVWRAGFKVTVKQGPNRVVRSVDTSQTGIEVAIPPDSLIDTYRKLFKAVEVVNLLRSAGEKPAASREEAGVELVRNVSGFAAAVKRNKKVEMPQMRLIRGRFWVYRYDPEKRFSDQGRKSVDEVLEREVKRPPVRPISRRIKAGQHYLVAEITFSIRAGGRKITWRALVELETRSVLYLRPLIGHVNGLVYEQDPYTELGDFSAPPDSDDTVLNPLADDVVLDRLDPPVDDVQSLSGSYAHVTQVEGPAPAIPTEAAGADFDYDVRSYDFAAVSAYFHVDQIFRHIADLGFDLDTYFSHTDLPVSVDHRCWSSHCAYDGLGGIDHVGYSLMDGDETDPLGRAVAPRVHWHEVCGHGILYEHVDDANFLFSHSAGDSISAIYFDPESSLWGVDGTAVGKPGDMRFVYAPWHPLIDRRFDRDVGAGWAWGGSHDDGQYESEQILATAHFRIYRSIGGDSPHLHRRQFASRMMHYLILRAVQNLTPATNPQYAREFAEELMTVDLLNWTSEGVYGGAYNKVIRWAFEKQGEFQVPLVSHGDDAFGSVDEVGEPPEVDVYVDDGRAGEYEYQHVHWETTTIWNRHLDDAVEEHQEPRLEETNYAYLKIKNRGTDAANNVVVKGYHTKPGAGLLWPGDFEAFTTPEIAAGSLAPNNTEEKIVGPFEWTPNVNAYGHDCMLMVVSADGDPSNVDNFTIGEVIPEWRLVPNDNNVGQRNVQPVPGGGGEEGLMAGLNGMSMWVGNPNPKRATMDLKVDLPDLLVKLGWRLTLEDVEGQSFVLAPGEKREVVFRLHAGSTFAPDLVEKSADPNIRVTVLADGATIGGMTYRLDPKLERPVNARRPPDRDCRDQAQALIDCLGVKGGKVKKAKIKEIVVGVKMRDDDCDC